MAVWEHDEKKGHRTLTCFILNTHHLTYIQYKTAAAHLTQRDHIEVVVEFPCSSRKIDNALMPKTGSGKWAVSQENKCIVTGDH